MAGLTGLSWSLACNGVVDFLFNSFAVSKENSSSLSSLPFEPDKALPCGSRPVNSNIGQKNRPDKRVLFFVNGGADGARTRDLMRDRHAL